MLIKTLQIKNHLGLHARPACYLVNLAERFKSRIEITKGNGTYNCKSIVSVLSACINYRDEVTLTIQGEDEAQAMEALTKAIDSGLNDPHYDS